MPDNDQICPHCGSQQNRMLTDHQGSVYWCHDCHHTWLPNPKPPPAAPAPAPAPKRPAV